MSGRCNHLLGLLFAAAAFLLFSYSHAYSDLVLDGRRRAFNMGKFWALPKARDESSVGGIHNCLSGDRLLLARPMALSARIATDVLHTRSIFLPAECASKRAGAWAMLKAMQHGGKASIVVPFTALYPIVTIFLAPTVLHEPVTLLQSAGLVCGLIPVVLLST